MDWEKENSACYVSYYTYRKDGDKGYICNGFGDIMYQDILPVEYMKQDILNVCNKEASENHKVDDVMIVNLTLINADEYNRLYPVKYDDTTCIVDLVRIWHWPDEKPEDNQILAVVCEYQYVTLIRSCAESWEQMVKSMRIVRYAYFSKLVTKGMLNNNLNRGDFTFSSPDRDNKQLEDGNKG